MSSTGQNNHHAKDIEVIETDWQNFVYADNDRVVKQYFQVGKSFLVRRFCSKLRSFPKMACAFGANLMMTCYGLICPASGFLLPQLEDPIIGFGINKEEGSWLGKMLSKL